MQTMMQAMQLQYYATPQITNQDYVGCGRYELHKKMRGQGERGADRQVNCRGGRGGLGSSDMARYCWTHVMCAHPGNYCRTPAKATR